MNRFYYLVYIFSAISVANWAEARQWGIDKRKLDITQWREGGA